MRARLLLVLLPMLLAACDVAELEDATGVEEERRPLGKADAPGTCEPDADAAPFCGGQAPGGCWCDVQCLDFGDCCNDKAEVCDEPEPECRRDFVLMGYWPPTNEMIRRFSPNPDQNPEGWVGENWRGLGYDVYAYFPEFPPDGDPSNDSIGSEGAVGAVDSDLRVDYQDTSADFWRIVDDHEPILLLTTSRGGSIGWEIEALEGGHGTFNQRDPSRDWRTDGYGEARLPTEATVDPRSWRAMNRFRQGETVESALPMQAIFEATTALDIASVEIDRDGTSGNFLSGFLGLHGIDYHREHEQNLAAGHIHVGYGLPEDVAVQLLETTLETMIAEHPASEAPCVAMD